VGRICNPSFFHPDGLQIRPTAEVLLMPRAVCLATILLVLSSASACAEAPPKRDANAALTYWQAFAQLPTLTDAEQKKLYTECVTMPLDAPIREILARNRTEYAFRMLHRGATRTRCDWDLAHEEGIGALAPNAQAARVLTALACLRARMRFDEGKSAEAIDDIVAAMTMARHISKDGILILVMLSYSLEQHLIDTLALNLPRLDARAIKDLKKRLDNLPPGTNPTQSMKIEEQFCLDWLARTVKEAKGLESLVTMLGGLESQRGDSPEKARERGQAFLKSCGGTTEGMLKVIDQSRQAYALMAKKLDEPLDSFEKAYDSVRKPGGNPVTLLLFPALPRVRAMKTRADIRRALLAAAIAVQLDGKGALEKHPDPAAGGAFEYVAFKGGFELRSKWRLDEKLRKKWKLPDSLVTPVTLTVGRREK
jgi:hypothetical protein